MEPKKLTMKERIAYAELFLRVSKAVTDGVVISKEDAQEAYDIISKLINNPALTESENDGIADLGLAIHKASGG